MSNLQNNLYKNPKFISLKENRNSKESLIRRINNLLSEHGNRTKIQYLKNKVDETPKVTEAVHNKIKELAEHENTEFDPGWIKDVIFSVDI